MNSKITIFLIAFLIPFYCMAEYGKLNYEITLKTTEGETFSGYGKTFSDLNKDSLSNKRYLIKRLSNNIDSIFFYMKRISYKNTSDLAPMQAREYLLFDKKGFRLNSVETINIFNVEMGSSLSGIANELTLEDTVWLKQDALEVIHISSFSCEFDIFVHEENDELNKIIDGMKIISKKYFNPENPDVNIDETNQYFNEIKKMKGMKVVVFTFCMC